MHFLALLVEGSLDETVGRRIAEHVGWSVSTVYGKRGFSYIKEKISGFNLSAASMPILVLADMMDTRMDCPPSVVNAWLPQRDSRMLLRVVVREIESWLLADRSSVAKFLRVPADKVPAEPENLEDPKQVLINLARRSRSATIRRLLVPAHGSTATEGPAYTSEMQHFAQVQWSIEEARRRSRSLDACLLAVSRLRRT